MFEVFVTEEPVIMVCAACGGIEMVPATEDPWEAFTAAVRQHRQSSRGCQSARQWIGQDLQDCPLPVSRPDGPVN